MANIKRTKRVLKRHKRDVTFLKNEYEDLTNQQNNTRREYADEERRLTGLLEDLRRNREKDMSAINEDKAELKAKISATNYHINSLEILLADHEAEMAPEEGEEEAATASE